MKILGLTIILIPTALASSDGASTSILTNFDSRQFVQGQSSHERDQRRKIKVTVERNVDDDSTDGYDSKTVTIERNVDDDSTDGSAISKSSSHSKLKSSATSPYEIPSGISVAASSTGTTTARASNSKNHKNSTVTDDAVSGGDDDAYDSNATTPTSDMMDVLNGNMDHDNASDTNSFGKSNGKIVLPPEHEPSETWIVAIVTLFSSMAISLCLTTAIRRCRKNNRRTGYQEVNNIVV
jgi:hypothetical protein